MNRRHFIATAGALATAGIAGCNAITGDDSDQSVSDPESTDSPGTDPPATDPPGTGTPGPTDLSDVDGTLVDTAQHLDVESHQFFESWSGVGVTGVVRNTGDVAYSLVEAEVYLSDGDDRIGDLTHTTEEELDTLDPGEEWRFFVGFQDVDRSAVEDYVLNIDGETVAVGADSATASNTDLSELDGTVTDLPEHLDVESHQFFESWSGVGVTGVVRNAGDATYSLVEVDLRLTDGDGRVDEFTDTTDQELDSLGPGEEWRFFAAFQDVDRSEIEGYELDVAGELGGSGS